MGESTSVAIVERHGSAVIDGSGKTTREINSAIREAIRAGWHKITVLNPGSQHCLAVGIVQPVEINFEGSLGYFAASLIDGPGVHVAGRVGWSVGQNMMSGTIVVEGHAGSSAGVCIRGGTLVIRGNAGGRTGLGMKGGTIIIGGSTGLNTGFMMQRGRIVVCGDARPGIGDSMYDGEIFIGGRVESLGIDTKWGEITSADREWLQQQLDQFRISGKFDWKKVIAAKKLYNYDTLEPLERKLML